MTLTKQERKELAAFFHGEFRRLLLNDKLAADAAKGKATSGPCTVYRPAERIVVTPTPDPRVNVPMGPPAVLLIPDCVTGLANFLRAMDRK